MRVVGVSARRAVACTSGWSADAAVAAALLAAGAEDGRWRDAVAVRSGGIAPRGHGCPPRLDEARLE